MNKSNFRRAWPCHSRRARSMCALALWLLAATGCHEDDATIEVSELLFVSSTAPDDTDALLESDERYRDEAVEDCLDALVESSAESAAEWSDLQNEVNAEMNSLGFDSEYQSSAAGDLLLWALSMRDAVSGTRWVDTDWGLLQRDMWSLLDIYLGSSKADLLREVLVDLYVQAWEQAQGRLILCPSRSRFLFF